MALDVITKLQAADSLLNAAVEMLLERQDYISAIVLGGAAEDLLHDMMTTQGRGGEVARAQMLPAIVAFAKQIDPSANQKDAIGLLRGAYNWLRHHDRGEGESLELDLRVEAVVSVERAIENRYGLDGTNHPRAHEVVAMSREA